MQEKKQQPPISVLRSSACPQADDELKNGTYLRHTNLIEPHLLMDHIMNKTTYFKQCAVAAAAAEGAAYSPKPNI